MTPRWEKLPSPPQAPTGALFMDAVLRPNRSLSVKAFTLLIAVFVALNAAIGVMFALQGAYPVLAFLALDVVLVIVAFRINYRDGRAQERVQVAADRVHVVRRSVKGADAHWVVNPAWARVEGEDSAVRIAAGGRHLDVAAFLSPEERAAFAAALEAAIRKARAAPG
ncbi:MAG: DUF2244 domain-containing protein [Caulobacterales bacterium]|jgi:uncharacterized membrane protein